MARGNGSGQNLPASFTLDLEKREKEEIERITLRTRTRTYEAEILDRELFLLSRVHISDGRMVLMTMEQDCWLLAAIYGLVGGYSFVFPVNQRPLASKCADLLPDIVSILEQVEKIRDGLRPRFA